MSPAFRAIIAAACFMMVCNAIRMALTPARGETVPFEKRGEL